MRKSVVGFTSTFLLVLFLPIAANASWHSHTESDGNVTGEIEFKSANSDCEDISWEEIDSIIEAWRFLFLNRHTIWDEIDDEINGNNTYFYTDPDQDRRDDWTLGIEHVVVSCHVNGTMDDNGAMVFTSHQSRCALNSPLMGGFEYDFVPGDIIHLCTDNLTIEAQDNNLIDIYGNLFREPLYANTIAHEMMHKFDGQTLQSAHPTNPITGLNETVSDFPDCDATTIGVAAEHMLMSADYRAEIMSIETDGHVNAWVVRPTVNVQNVNLWSAGGRNINDVCVGPVPRSFRCDMNRENTLAMYYNGTNQSDVEGNTVVGPVAGGDFQLYTPYYAMSTSFSGGAEPTANMYVEVDASDLISERRYDSSETNNWSTAHTVDLQTDLEITSVQVVDIQDHYMEYVPGAGIRTWREITSTLQTVTHKA